MIRPAKTKLQLADKQQAVSCGGIAVIVDLINKLQLRKHINESASVFKLHLAFAAGVRIAHICVP
jgi:hypothetical protein